MPPGTTRYLPGGSGRPSGRPRIATVPPGTTRYLPGGSGRPSGRPRIATVPPGTTRYLPGGSGRPSGRPRIATKAASVATPIALTGSGRPSGRPRIATTMEGLGFGPSLRAAAVLRDGRGSQPHQGPSAPKRRVGQRPSFGTAEDRNQHRSNDGRITHPRSGRPSGRPRIATGSPRPRSMPTWQAAAVLRDGRGSQLKYSSAPSPTRPGSGRPSGRPRIATGKTGGGRPPDGPQRPSFGTAEDRNWSGSEPTCVSGGSGRPSGRPRIATP